MISKTHITHRMETAPENRAGRDLPGGSPTGRNMNRATPCDAVEATAKRREGQLFADSETRKPRNYQIAPE